MPSRVFLQLWRARALPCRIILPSLLHLRNCLSRGYRQRRYRGIQQRHLHKLRCWELLCRWRQLLHPVRGWVLLIYPCRNLLHCLHCRGGVWVCSGLNIQYPLHLPCWLNLPGGYPCCGDSLQPRHCLL